MKHTHRPTALIVGVEGLRLSEDERQFFRDTDPMGFILFKRNCESPEQVTKLVNECRKAVDRNDAPILIDQEGGRVQRLCPPHWRDVPPARRFVDLYECDSGRGLEALYLNALLMARDLTKLGITINCAPVLDVPHSDTHDVIGDRALGAAPNVVSKLARAVCCGLLAGGVLPVIKHLPGHGRARTDSHLELPLVDASLDELEDCDFLPFKELSDMPWAMTAHVLFSALDESGPATTSPKVIQEVIREKLGFDGVLVSDDIGMGALSGKFDERVRASLEAGCDIALHCSGDLQEMIAATKGAMVTSETSMERLRRGEVLRQEIVRDEIVKEAALGRLEELLA